MILAIEITLIVLSLPALIFVACGLTRGLVACCRLLRNVLLLLLFATPASAATFADYDIVGTTPESHAIMAPTQVIPQAFSVADAIKASTNLAAAKTNVQSQTVTRTRTRFFRR